MAKIRERMENKVIIKLRKNGQNWRENGKRKFQEIEEERMEKMANSRKNGK